jgi:hypothetical protein
LKNQLRKNAKAERLEEVGTALARNQGASLKATEASQKLLQSIKKKRTSSKQKKPPSFNDPRKQKASLASLKNTSGSQKSRGILISSSSDSVSSLYSDSSDEESFATHHINRIEDADDEGQLIKISNHFKSGDSYVFDGHFFTSNGKKMESFHRATMENIIADDLPELLHYAKKRGSAFLKVAIAKQMRKDRYDLFPDDAKALRGKCDIYMLLVVEQGCYFYSAYCS